MNDDTAQKSWLWLLAASGVLAVAMLHSAPELQNHVPPSFTNGANGPSGAQGIGQGGARGSDQPSPQTGTMDQNGIYDYMNCGNGGDGGSGGSGDAGCPAGAGGIGANLCH